MRRLLPLLVVLTTLAGCATAPPRPESSATPGRSDAHLAAEQERRALADWTLTGRVAVIHHEESWHATLHWKQRGERYHIRLIAPLGQGSIALRGLPGAVVMEGDDASFMAADPETLLERHLGWRIPVTGLRYWIRGLVDPVVDGTPLYADDGLPRRLDQSGWRIDFRRWGESGEVSLPEKVFMEAEGLKVRVVIDRWQLNEN